MPAISTRFREPANTKRAAKTGLDNRSGPEQARVSVSDRGGSPIATSSLWAFAPLGPRTFDKAGRSFLPVQGESYGWALGLPYQQALAFW